MIGQNAQQILDDKKKSITAIKDAFVTFLFVLLSALIAAGFPPTLQVLYTSGLAGLFMGVVSYMNAYRIQKPSK